MMPVQIEIDFTFREAVAEQKVIEEEGLVKVKLSCYLPTGNPTADGTIPYRGIIASNEEHLGMMALMFDDDMCQVAVWECRDIGGNQMLRDGTAIDIFVNNIEEGRDIIERYNGYAYIKWLTREEWLERCELITSGETSFAVDTD